ncbi:hypothetical protein LCGC14_0421340 [marine sediment metagenome]|uniref:Uncharacterized protein n=1 Tax=marine sediment metagenome TaxID=412755 RepID=A0A0F9T8V3_9ZZZZ
MAKKAKKKVAKKAKKKVAKKATATIPKPETYGAKPDLPITSATGPAKANCECCNELVDKTMLRICPKCGFKGCIICRKSGNCPTCGYALR